MTTPPGHVTTTGNHSALRKLDETAHHRFASERSPIAIALTGGEGHVIRHVNPAFCQALGGLAEAFEGRSVVELFEAREPLRERLDRVVVTCSTDLIADVSYVGPDLQRARASLIVQPILDDEARQQGLAIHVISPVGAVAMAGAASSAVLDPTDLARVNERLLLAGLRERELTEQARQSASELKALLENMAEGVIVIDAGGDVVLINPKGREILGLPARSHTDDDRRSDLRWPSGQRIDLGREIVARVLGGSQFAEEEVLLLNPGSRDRHLVFSSSVVHDSGGNVVLAIAVYRDITELRDLERLKEQYVALISHDLRGPLSTAKVAASFLGKLAASNDLARALAMKIDDNLARMDHMLRDLLDAQRIQAGQPMSLRLRECDVVEIARGVADDVSTLHGGRVVVRGREALHGMWSPDELRRAIWNLIANALKYGAPETPVVVSIDQQGDRAVLSVHNQGPPISPADQARLFTPFARARPANAEGPGGWGLGLTLVRGVAEAHGGSVHVTSDAPTGTTFTIDLPLDSRGR